MNKTLQYAILGILLFLGYASFAQDAVALPWKSEEKTTGVKPEVDIKICTPTSLKTNPPLYVAKSKEKFVILNGLSIKQFDKSQLISINILKSSDATIAKYGDEAKNGVIEVEIPAKLLKQITKASKKQALTKL